MHRLELEKIRQGYERVHTESLGIDALGYEG